MKQNLSIAFYILQSTDEGQGRQGHVISLDLLSVKVSDAGSYECLVKPFDGAAAAAIVNLTVYGKYLFLFLSVCSTVLLSLNYVMNIEDVKYSRIFPNSKTCVIFTHVKL